MPAYVIRFYCKKLPGACPEWLPKKIRQLWRSFLALGDDAVKAYLEKAVRPILYQLALKSHFDGVMFFEEVKRSEDGFWYCDLILSQYDDYRAEMECLATAPSKAAEASLALWHRGLGEVKI